MLKMPKDVRAITIIDNRKSFAFSFTHVSICIAYS